MPDGRYVVRFPFKSGIPPNLGESRNTALASLRRSELRLLHEPEKATLYRYFLIEYETLGHMKQVSNNISNFVLSAKYYIPHAVFRESSTTTRLRVVFNVSSLFPIYL